MSKAKRRTTPLWGVFRKDDGVCMNVYFDESSAQQECDESRFKSLYVVKGHFTASQWQPIRGAPSAEWTYSTKEWRQVTNKPYPTWVCAECGYNGRRYTLTITDRDWFLGYAGGIATWHTGICGVCTKVKAVTEPRDFGYPHFKGHVAP